MQPSKYTGESHETKAYMSLCKTFKIPIKMGLVSIQLIANG